MLGRNDPKLGADRPRSRGGSTAFGADVGRIDPGRIDSGADRPVPDIYSYLRLLACLFHAFIYLLLFSVLQMQFIVRRHNV